MEKKVYKEDFEREYKGLSSNVEQLYKQVGALDNKEYKKYLIM